MVRTGRPPRECDKAQVNFSMRNATGGSLPGEAVSKRRVAMHGAACAPARGTARHLRQVYLACRPR